MHRPTSLLAIAQHGYSCFVARTSVSGVSPYESRYGFSRAIRIGQNIHVAGTAPVPTPGTTLALDAYGQMARCAQIALEAIAELGGDAMSVVRTRMYVTSAEDADAVGRAHREFFGDAMPVATMVVVAALLDSQWLVELEVEAVVS